jgi:mono/diheme cytochrome c family protein
MRIRTIVSSAAVIGGLLAGPALAQDGATTFSQSCAACHQPQGQGIPGAFPALAKNPFVQGPPNQVAHVILNGRGGMPKFSGDLSDDQIAAVATYIRSAWGNKAGPVTPSVVTAERNAGALPPPSEGQQAH